jgi:ATP-binding cassette subfamily F protein 3
MILLENFLRDFRGGHLIVSHDREFLKRTCDHTLELENGTLTLYPGDIEEYFEFKEMLLAQKEAHNRGVQKKRDQLQEFIDRFRAKASTASRAQSKMKQLEKLNTLEIAHQASTVRIPIPQVERKAGVAFSSEDLAIGYPEKEVAHGIHFSIERGHHVSILGDNGEGKTTFLRTIAGNLPAKGGTFRWGAGLKTAYYAQHIFSVLDPEDNVYAYLVRQSAEGVTSQEVLAMAGCFLFKGDDTKKKVKVLSGGERARLVLAGLLLSKSQVLLLDEPTNHLDFETVEALGSALKRFAGTVFFISHDRTFVNLLATHILEVKKGKVKRYPGTYEDYVYHLECLARNEKEESLSHAEPRRPEKTQAPRVQAAAQEAKAESEAVKIKKLLRKAEQRLHALTKERGKLLEEMSRNPFHYSKDRNLRLKQLQISIEEAETERRSLPSSPPGG